MKRTAPVTTIPPRNIALLLASQALVLLPHAGRMPWWMIALIVLPFVVRGMALIRAFPMPGVAVHLLLMMIAAAGIYWHFGSLLGRGGGTAILAVLAAFKLLELRSRRDVLVLVMLAYFLVLTNFLYTQSIPTALLVVAAALAMTTQLVAISDLHHPRLNAGKLKLAGVLMLQGLPLMLILFVFFPRIDGPMWRWSLHDGTTRTGLSETMSPGMFSNLALSDEVAFRVRWASERPPPSQLYWRAMVMWDYDGKQWRAKEQFGRTPSFTGTGKRYRYQITMEPHDQKWLFALDLPINLPENARMQPDFSLVHRTPITGQHRYRLTSYAEYEDAGLQLWGAQRRAALKLPRNIGPKAQELAAQWRETYADDAIAIAEAAMNWYRSEGFEYTLTPDILDKDPIDQFLFESRGGFCEHYASSFVFLMRAAGVPARVVTGYMGGEMNPHSDYMIVRQADAHAWAEIWSEESGWVRMDPTGAISPGRISLGLAGGVSQTGILPQLVSAQGPAWLRDLRLGWDAVNNSWIQWVLGYERGRQRDFMQWLGLGSVKPSTLVVAMFAALGLVLGLVSAWMFLRGNREKLDPAQKLYRRYLRKLAKLEIRPEPHEGPFDLAQRVSQIRPILSQAAKAIAKLYAQERYGPRSSEQISEVRQAKLRQLIRSLPS